MPSAQGEDIPRPSETVTDDMSYTTTAHYAPAPQSYYSAPSIVSAPVHAIGPIRDVSQRKRPKYTRSKTGCLTCRVKKIKCDETKPSCMRCTHGQRDCTWPEGVPSRKKSMAKKDGADGRPSTAGSSGLSEASTPPTRERTPPRLSEDIGLSSLSSRHSEPFSQSNPLAGDADFSRRSNILALDRSGSAQGFNIQSNANLSMMSSVSSYSSRPRYDSGYPSTMTTSGVADLSNRIHAHTPVSSGIRLGQHVNQWNTPLMAPIDPIEPFFPSIQERNLIRHYCDNSLNIIVAAPSESSFFPGNPVVAANLPLALQPSGADPSAEALRLGLLGVAAIHQSFLLARNVATQHAAENMLQLAHSFRMNSKQQLAKSCTTVEGTQSDTTLAATIAIALMDIFSGGRNWARNMNLALTLVNVRGGAAKVLAHSGASKPGTMEGVARTRLLLEILAVYDIFGCLGTGKEPTLLNPSAESWWYDEANHSFVEQVFGISRSLVPLLARVVSFVSRTINNTAHISEIPDGVIDADDFQSSEYQELYNLLEVWTPPTSIMSPRVCVGNEIYQKTAQIVLLRDVLRLSAVDTSVQERCDVVLTLCYECAITKVGVDLIWPVIIAGSHVFGQARNRVAAIFEAFRSQCCYEIDTSEQIVLQVWKRLDQGHPRAEWRSVMRDFNLSVLIL